MKDISKIAEKIYFDHPRLNSKAQLRDIINIETGNELDCTQVDIIFDMVVNRANNPRPGEFLDMDTRRKGKFVMQVTRVDDEWITGVIVAGEAKAMLDHNRRYEGEEVTCRRSLCHFYPIRPVTLKGAL